MYNKKEILRRKEAVGIQVSIACLKDTCVLSFEQDIRELVLHVAADAPPPSWVRVEVCQNYISLDTSGFTDDLEPSFRAESSRHTHSRVDA